MYSFYALDVGLGFVTNIAAENILAAVRFLCPRCRAGLCDVKWRFYNPHLAVKFLCPRCRAGLCDQVSAANDFQVWLYGQFLCPRCRAGLCDAIAITGWSGSGFGFYALDVGLGFVTRAFSWSCSGA